MKYGFTLDFLTSLCYNEEKTQNPTSGVHAEDYSENGEDFI